MKTPRDLVLSHLRQEKVQLWLPPYHQREGDADATKSDALRNLAQLLTEQLSSSSETPFKVEDIYSILSQLQSHALQKLKKYCVDIKILATQQHFANLSSDDDVFASWGDTVATIKNGNTKKSPIVLRVENISSTLTVDKLSLELCCALNATTARVIFKGKHISSSSSGGEGNNLRKIVSSNDGKDEQKKNELLCIVSGYGYVPPAPAAAAAAAAAASSVEVAARSEKEIIDSIRSSASRIAYNQSGFEITDQNGNLVPMSQTDSISLLTALGLHRIGRSKMEKCRESNDDEGDKRNSLASALVFLLEADAEWQGSSTLDIWKTNVDNYGLLQLDIAWNYLLLGSLENLTDATRRLEIAETVLRKQVHSNFVTLALVNAESNNPIPPICTIFVRLFLLQGVANKMRNCNDTATERLTWARVLCQQLRASCPPDKVEILCGAYCVEPSTAISALRKLNGDPDAAGNFIASLHENESRSAKRRKRQHKLGKCANNSDFVNLDLVQTLSDLLGFGGVNNDTDDGRDDQTTSNLICSGVLRLTNNDIETSLALYNEIGAQGVLQRAAQLDKDTGIRRASIRDKFEVSDIDVVSLVSMGVEEERGRNALRATGNVDSALLWLLKDDDNKNNACDNVNGEVERSSSGESKQDSEGSPPDDCCAEDAYDFLERELGHALSNDSKETLEKEWLGVDLKEEWEMIEEYK
mmetsp:Transcript_30083/g.44895  ORF Transcript_30083/g.44895 Transcript_30083/m.44895 type:complete len:700 (+) Transcript_30083:74-2173(+)